MLRHRSTSAPHLSLALIALAVGVTGCGGPVEAEQVEVMIETDADELRPVTTNLGYAIDLTEARIMVQDLTFATGGELLTRHVLKRTYNWLIPSAHAHAGHNEGGDVTGELPGRLLLDYLPGEKTQLGMATLLTGDYKSANMTFSRATSEDLADKDDPLLGHTAIFRGTASRDGSTLEFEALISIEHDTAMIGIPFEAHIKSAADQPLRLQLRSGDEVEDETLFDDLDFALLDTDQDGYVSISPKQTEKAESQAHSILRDALLVHDLYAIQVAK